MDKISMFVSVKKEQLETVITIVLDNNRRLKIFAELVDKMRIVFDHHNLIAIVVFARSALLTMVKLVKQSKVVSMTDLCVHKMLNVCRIREAPPMFVIAIMDFLGTDMFVILLNKTKVINCLLPEECLSYKDQPKVMF